MLRRLALTLAITALTFGAHAQGVTTHKITDSIYMLEGRGGNIGVSVGDDGILIIDTQFDNMAQPILDAIDDIQEGGIDFIVNTHFHGDHTGGNQALGQEAVVVAHKNVRVRMIGRRDLDEAEFRNSLPFVTYEDKAEIHYNGEDIELKHYPAGHTDTDTVVHFPKANVIHMGDHFFVDRFPFIDEPNGGNVKSYMNNVRSIIESAPDDVTIIPGHGPLATKDDLKRFLKLVEDSTAYIQKQIDAGKDKKAIQEEGLPSEWDEAGTGFINTNRWIHIVYESFTN